jgi:SH3-like domain-containing protein
MDKRTAIGAGLIGLFAAGLVALGMIRSHDHGPASGHVTPSGLPVPRYVSLKFDAVNARAGPGDDHRLLFVFHARGLPVQVVAETNDWRRICDPDGGLSWVHRRTTDGRRTVMAVSPKPAPIHAGPKDGAPITAYLAPRALADFGRCEHGWCAVHIGNASGWTPETGLWGVMEAPQCR